MALQNEAALIAAHQKTIEEATGKRCVIRLIDTDSEILKWLTLEEIERTVEQFNTSDPIKSKTSTEETVNLRKIFCFIAKKAGFSANAISRHLGRKDHTLVLHYLREKSFQIQKQPELNNLYNTVLKTIVEQNKHFA